jgi:hypothetical protein
LIVGSQQSVNRGKTHAIAVTTGRNGHWLNLSSGLVALYRGSNPFDQALLAHTTSAEVISDAQ